MRLKSFEIFESLNLYKDPQTVKQTTSIRRKKGGKGGKEGRSKWFFFRSALLKSSNKGAKQAQILAKVSTCNLAHCRDILSSLTPTYPSKSKGRRWALFCSHCNIYLLPFY